MTVTFPGAKSIDGLLSGYTWTGTVGRSATVYYGFDRTGWPYLRATPSSFFDPVSPPDHAQRIFVKDALDQWSKVINVTFVETSDVRKMKLCFSSAESARELGYTHVRFETAPGTLATAEIFFDPEHFNENKAATARFAAVHEIGHALGLKHPHDKGLHGAEILAPALDDWRHTIMSYNRDDKGVSKGAIVPVGPQVLDVEAAQYLYGANMSAGAGDDVYQLDGRLLPDGRDYTANFLGSKTMAIQALWDAGGRDCINASSAQAGVIVDLRGGLGHDISVGNTIWSLTHNTVIENVTGSMFNDRIIGNASANSLYGAEGRDILRGSAGADKLAGGSGRDVLAGGVGSDDLTGGEGADVFRYLSKMESGALYGIDRIRDFIPGEDRLDLRKLGFASLDEFDLRFDDIKGRTWLEHEGGDFALNLSGHVMLSDADVLW